MWHGTRIHFRTVHEKMHSKKWYKGFWIVNDTPKELFSSLFNQVFRGNEIQFRHAEVSDIRDQEIKSAHCWRRSSAISNGKIAFNIYRALWWNTCPSSTAILIIWYYQSNKLRGSFVCLSTFLLSYRLIVKRAVLSISIFLVFNSFYSSSWVTFPKCFDTSSLSKVCLN